MSLEIKILIAWFVCLIALRIIAAIYFSSTNYNWKYYKEQAFWGCFYSIWKLIGIVSIIGYLVVKLFIWWFNIQL
jgi:hypothetical protein